MKIKNCYNTTDLDPLTSFERHIFHRDQFAHYIRWSFVLKELQKVRGEKIVCDFGCGKGNLLEVLYRNKYLPKKYIGLDIRTKTIEKARDKFNNLLGDRVFFINEDLVTLDNGNKLSNIKADIVTSFEVVEHVGKLNIDKFLQNFKSCGNENAIYYISTPNYDPSVGAAGNHTYPDFKGGQPVPQEFEYYELMDALEKNGFEIIKTIGTFASQKDYKSLLKDYEQVIFNKISEVFDNNLVSVIMAAIVPAELARNALWILKSKK